MWAVLWLVAGCTTANRAAQPIVHFIVRPMQMHSYSFFQLARPQSHPFPVAGMPPPFMGGPPRPGFMGPPGAEIY